MFKSLILSLVIISSTFAASGGGNDSIAAVMPGKVGKLSVVQKSDGYKYPGKRVKTISKWEPMVLQVTLSREYVNSVGERSTNKNKQRADDEYFYNAARAAEAMGLAHGR